WHSAAPGKQPALPRAVAVAGRFCAVHSPAPVSAPAESARAPAGQVGVQAHPYLAMAPLPAQILVTSVQREFRYALSNQRQRDMGQSWVEPAALYWKVMAW